VIEVYKEERKEGFFFHARSLMPSRYVRAMRFTPTMAEEKGSLENALDSAYFHRYDYRHTHGIFQKLVVYATTV